MTMGRRIGNVRAHVRACETSLAGDTGGLVCVWTIFVAASVASAFVDIGWKEMVKLFDAENSEPN